MKSPKKKVVSLILYNEKGGVGKSFFSTWLSYLLATGGVDGKSKKYNVVFVDLDSQQNASNTFLPMQYRKGLSYSLPPLHPYYVEGREANGSWNGYSTSSDIIFDRAFSYYPVKDVPNLRVLPSEGRVDRLNDMLKSTSQDHIPLISEQTKEFLEREEELGVTDIVIFDSPPSKTAICEGFLSMCSHVLIPTQLEYDSVDAVPKLLQNISIYNQVRKTPINVLGVIPNLMRSTNLTNLELEHYSRLVGHLASYEREQELPEPILADDFFFVNRVIFKPLRKPDDLVSSFKLNKDKKAKKEMNDFYHLICKRLNLGDI